MKRIRQGVCLALALMLLTAFLPGCKTSAADSGVLFKSFRDVPGITAEEINEIQALQTQADVFVYAMPASTEAFISGNGEINGYSSLLCGWMTELFGITFAPAIYELSDIFTGLESGEIDFTGELTASAERREIYYMTDTIAERVIKCYRLAKCESFADIMETRPVRCCFIEGAYTVLPVTAELGQDGYEIVFTGSINDVYRLLKSGEIDAFFYSNPAEAFFDRYDDMTMEDFFPLILLPVSLCAKDIRYRSVISVMQKAMDHGGSRYMAQLYSEGYGEYLKHKLYMRLDENERSYIKNTQTVKLGASYDNYPIAFYNEHDKQWQGIAVDVLNEISHLTGLEFQITNDNSAEWPDVFKMLEDGGVSMVAELLGSDDFNERFLVPENYIMTDRYALLSRTEFPNIDVNDVLYLKVGLMQDTASASTFIRWFSDHSQTILYKTYDDAIRALDSGAIDLLMSSGKQMMFATNYREDIGYKINFLFDYPVGSVFGFAKNEEVLCSVVDKALDIIDRDGISERWMRKEFDYRLKMTQARIPWLIGSGLLMLIVVALMAVLLKLNRGKEKQLQLLVRERTFELEKQSSVMKAIFDSSPDLVFCMDMNLNYMSINKSMEKHFNIHEADVIGKSDREVLTNLSEQPLSFIEEMNNKVINEKKKIIFEETVPGYDGEVTYFETTKAPLWLGDEVIGLLGIAHDITLRKMMETDIENASKSKSEFLANMSHELRTPLNVIIGLTDLLLEAQLPEKVLSDILSVSNAGGTLLSIVNDILDISKIESGKLDLIPVNYHIPSLLNDTLVLINTYIGEKPVKLILKISDSLPNMLFGDELRVKQIMNNLLSNAVKYTPEGEVELRVECETQGDEVWMDIYVRDTGIGIKEEYLADLFAEYQRVDTTANRKTEGTGLGLPISLRLAQMMQGNVTVKSEYGAGSEFHARLKQGFAGDDTIGSEVAGNLMNFNYSQAKRQTYNRLVRSDMSYARVLVVDDMQNNLDVAAGLLSKYRLAVDGVTSGKAAVELIDKAENVYDAVFMDHMMPEMDGIQATAAIRKLKTDYALNIPIIALTANAVTGARQQFLDNGFQDFLSKPIDVMLLDAILRKWVRKPSAERAAVIDDQPRSAKRRKIKINIPGIDSEQGLFRYAGDDEIFLTILRSFALNARGDIERLRKITRETFGDAATIAHGFKGTCGNICAGEIREQAAELEMLAREDNYPDFSQKVEPFAKNVVELLDNIDEFFVALDKKNGLPKRNAPDPNTLIKLKQSCEAYDMSGIDEALDELSGFTYETSNDLIPWLKEKINITEFGEVIGRLDQELG